MPEAGGSARRQGTVVLVLDALIQSGDVPALCERLSALHEARRPAALVCDVGAIRRPDASTLDALARLQLAARRLGLPLRLRHACDELLGLIAIAGLDDILNDESLVELRGQIEQREQRLGVEEEAQPDDPAP